MLVPEHQSVRAERIGAPADCPIRFRHGLCRLVRPSDPQAGLWKNSWLRQKVVGTWLKSIHADITEGRLCAVGSGDDIELADCSG